jgi:hypothetical protein
MTAFSRMYEAHTARQDTIIFPAFKKSIGQKAYEELGEQFKDIEKREFGGDGFDMALDTVARGGGPGSVHRGGTPDRTRQRMSTGPGTAEWAWAARRVAWRGRTGRD